MCSVAFSPDGATIVSGSGGDNTIKVWDAVNFRAHIESEWETFDKEVDGEFKWENKRIQTWWRNTITGHEQGVKPSVGVHTCQSNPGMIKVWDAGVSALTPTPISFKSEHPPLLVAASLELKAEKQNAHAEQHGESIKAVQFSPDGSTIVSCGVDKTIKVWDAGVLALTPLNP